MKTGDVYFLDNSESYPNAPVRIYERIICSDQYETFTHEGAFVEVEDIPNVSLLVKEYQWKLNKRMPKNLAITRFPNIFIERYGRYIDTVPYSQEQLDILRIDLPMRLGRFRSISWGNKILESENSINELLFQNNINSSMNILNVNEIYLYGNTKQGGPQSSYLIKAKNDQFFTMAELLYHANQIQMAIKSNKDFVSDGIGIYRSGYTKGGIPEYYIWGFYDLTGCLKKYEDMGIDITQA